MNILKNNEVLHVSKRSYAKNRIALTCTDEYGYPYATLTVNLPHEEIEKDEAFIDVNNHNWAVQSLKDAGIISGNILRLSRSGYCTYPLYKINL